MILYTTVEAALDSSLVTVVSSRPFQKREERERSHGIIIIVIIIKACVARKARGQVIRWQT